MRGRALFALFLGFLLTVSVLSSARAASFTFLVFGDNRDGDSVFKDLIKMTNQEKNVSFALSLGDITPRGTEEQYLHYIDMCAPAKYKIYNIIGNHDAINGGGERFEKHFGPRYYAFDAEGFHFVVLDTAGWRGLGNTQWEWLTKDLETHKTQPIFVSLHKPLTDVSGFYQNHVFTPEREAERLARLLKPYDIKMIFGGHIHGYARGTSYGLPAMISAGAGAPLYMPYSAGGFYHYVRVRVAGDKISYDVVKLYDE